LRTAILGIEEEAVGIGVGTVRKSVGELGLSQTLINKHLNKKPIQNFVENVAWAYPGPAQIF